MGLALAGKARGEDAGGWFDSDIGENNDPKSISHEHTFNEDTADFDQLEATLSHLSQQVGRRLREHGLYARTIQLKLRTSDFTPLHGRTLPPAPPNSITRFSRKSVNSSGAIGNREVKSGCLAFTLPASGMSRVNSICSIRYRRSVGRRLWMQLINYGIAWGIGGFSRFRNERSIS